ncbi:hypothetical protein [Hymenobacter gummosus]|nr:hypothetical protein [Hymenobacter gummosus]
MPVDANGAVKVRLSPAEDLNVNIKSVDHNPIIGGKLPVAVYW